MADKLHHLVLTGTQMDAARDGLALLKDRISWARGTFRGTAREAERLRDAASQAHFAIGEHLYGINVAPACEKAGCPHLLEHQKAFDPDSSDVATPPQEVLINRAVELLDQVDKTLAGMKWLTQEAATDPTKLTGKPSTPDDAENAELLLHQNSVGNEDRVKLIRLMDTFALKQQAHSLRSAIRMLRRSEQH